MRVFVSSTVYDLVDARAEIAAQLRSMGITPVLSDDKLSDFRVQPDVNSIETCLVNIDSCDEMILLLDQRYGPSLEKCGFDDVSATHLEYRRARAASIPVHVFARDRLQAEYSIWKKNGRHDELKLEWVKPGNTGLFQILEEHSKLEASSAKSNWYATFTNSVDLKAATAKHFEERILPRRLVDAIEGNRFPLFGVSFKLEEFNLGRMLGVRHIYRADVANVGGATAFRCVTYWEDDPAETRQAEILPPGQSFTMVFFIDWRRDIGEVSKKLIVRYESPMGIAVTECYELAGKPIKGVMSHGSTLLERRFVRAAPMSFEIEDAGGDDADSPR